MEKDFVPYEESLALKELGFVEFCIGNYADDKKHTLFTDKGRRGKVDAPTFSQAFRWFREKHGLSAIVSRFGYAIENEFGQIIYNISDDENPLCYEESEILCLKKLIGIVNEK